MPDIFDGSARDYEPEPLVTTDETMEVPTEAPSSSEEKSARRPEPRHIDDYSQVMRAEMPSSNPLNSYAAKPLDTSFDSQHDTENVVLLLRQHPVTQIKWVLIGLLLVFVPFLFSFIGLLDFLPLRFQTAAFFGWYLIVTGYSLEAFLTWFYNVYIITDERVVDIDFHSLLYKNISSAKIDNIEDVTATTGGALRSIFDFGTISIQTAGAQTQFDFADIPHPAKVTALINEMLLEEEREKIEGRIN